MHLKPFSILICAILVISIAVLASAHAGHSHSHGHDHSHEHAHDHATTTTNTKKANTARQLNEADETAKTTDTKPPSLLEQIFPKQESGISIWYSALIATAVIGVLPVFILFFIPLIKQEGRGETAKVSVNEPLLKTLLSFAVGGLLGDVFLHLLPHAIEPHSHDSENVVHSHEHADEHDEHAEDTQAHTHDLSLGLLILAGIMTFFLIEKIMRIRGKVHSHSQGHSHGHEDKAEKARNKKKNTIDAKSSPKVDSKSEHQPKSEPKQNPSKPPTVDEQKMVTGYLNIIADVAHNFTDGMAIAASFLVSPKVGMSTAVAVFFHEIPHEIGDYAILIQSGFSKNKAMLVQLWTALGAMAGCAVGLLAGGYIESVNWILPFTAGGFIYIAIADVMPELLENSTVGQTIKEFFGIGIGIGMMSLIALYE